MAKPAFFWLSKNVSALSSIAVELSAQGYVIGSHSVDHKDIGARFQALNVEHFFWRVDSLDWPDKNPASIRDRVVAQMEATGRGIVLFHDIHPQSAKASQLLVDYLKVHPEFTASSILDIPGMPKY